MKALYCFSGSATLMMTIMIMMVIII